MDERKKNGRRFVVASLFPAVAALREKKMSTEKKKKLIFCVFFFHASRSLIGLNNLNMKSLVSLDCSLFHIILP